jgi:putative ABC transport system permease protein
VSSAAVVSHAPLTGGAAGTRVIAAGSAVPQDQDGGALYKTVSTDYLRTMQLPLRRGRWFTDADMDGSGGGVVISEQLAKRNWPGQDPIGRSITVFRASQARPDFGKPVVLSVIGVVQDVRNFGFAADPNPDVYVPYTLEVWPHLWLVARTNLDEQSVIPAIRRVVQGIDRNIPVSGSASSMGFLPMNFFISQSLSSRRFSTAIAIGFAAAALLLAVIGIYGATAYGVAQRTNEFGIRMALGAAPNSILTLVLGQSVRIAGAGAIVGVVVAFASTRLIRKMLFGTSPTDPATFVLVPLLLLTAVVVACVLPARRAAALDPTRAIRME